MDATDRQEPAPTASDVVVACEQVWRAFQRRHSELPDAVIVLGSGVDRGRLVKLGHWWGGRWDVGGQHRGEVLLAGEALHLPVEEVFEVLLHEAAHGLNAARGVKDASRGGRYHNARFKATAIEVGLAVDQRPPYGWAKTSLGAEAGSRYAAEIEGLRDAVRIARRIDTGTGKNGDGSGPGREAGVGGRGGRSVALVCGCGRRMRMAPSVAAKGPVLCGLCGAVFAAPGAEPRSSETREALHPVDTAKVAAPSDVVMAASSAQRAWRWAERHGERLDETLVAADESEARNLNWLARSFRRQLGHMTGPDLRAGPLLLAPGDQVMVATQPPPDGPELPDVGVLGQVVAVEVVGGRLTIDFPIAGRYRLDADAAGRFLDYGYAVTASAASSPLQALASIDSTTDVDPPRPLAEVIELELP